MMVYVLVDSNDDLYSCVFNQTKSQKIGCVERVACWRARAQRKVRMQGGKAEHWETGSTGSTGSGRRGLRR